MFGKTKTSLSENNSRILMLELNRIIERIADEKARAIIAGKMQDTLVYPPNNGFNSMELKYVKSLSSKDESSINAFRKIIADAIACGFFEFLNLVDGTGDPEVGAWDKDGICIIDKDDSIEENNDMLHDLIFEMYWEWKKTRNEKWKLDTIEE